MKRTRKLRRGRIDPRSRYTGDGLMIEAGIGQQSLSKARLSGLVKPIPVGRQVWYRGRDIIAWIDSHAK